jgi:hypothetical protein
MFLVCRKSGLVKSGSSSKDLSALTMSQSTMTGEHLNQPQMFECPPVWNVSSYEIKRYAVEVTFNGVTSILTFKKSMNWFRS